MDDDYETLRSTIEALTMDYDKFREQKIKACGLRVRNNLLNCKKLCDKIRKQVLLDMKAVPVKARKEKDPYKAMLEVTEGDMSMLKLERQSAEPAEHPRFADFAEPTIREILTTEVKRVTKRGRKATTKDS